MGILDNVSGLEDIASGTSEEKQRQKPKKAESARADSLSNSRLEKIEDSIVSLKEAVEELEKEKSGAGENNIQDILRRLDETDRKIDETYAAAAEKIKSMEMQGGEKRGFFGLKNDSEKRIDEAIKKLDKNSEIIAKKQEEAAMGVEERIKRLEKTSRSRENSHSGDIESLKKTLDRIMADVKNADSRICSVENNRGDQSGLKESVMNDIKNSMQHSMNGFKSGIDRHIADASKKMDEISETLLKRQDAQERRIGERLNEAAPMSDMENARKMAEKNSMELRSRMDVLQKYVDGKLGSMDMIVEDRLRNSAAGRKEAELLKNHEGRIIDMEKKQGEMLKIKEDMMESMKDSLQHSMNGFKSGIDRHIGDAVKKMDETAVRIGKEQESIRKDVNEKMSAAIRQFDEKVGNKLNEFSKRMDSNRNDNTKAISEALRNIPKSDDIRKGVDERINAKIAEFSRKVDEISRYDLEKLKSVADAEKNLEEKLKIFALNSDVEKFWRDAENSKKQMSERMKDFASRSDLEKSLMEMKAAEEMINEKIESIKRGSNAFVSKSDIDRLNNAVGGRLNEFSKKLESVSKFDLDKINSLANAEKKIDENLKLFALNSDVEKIWKDTESLKRYIDEKTKMADSLANSLRVWETRNMQVMEKERDFDEKLGAFPELKLLEGRIRKMERALAELQKHFVAAQIAEPIIME